MGGSRTPAGLHTGGQEPAVTRATVPSPRAGGPDASPPSITFPVDLTPFQMQK